MARAGMAGLIARLRELIEDTGAAAKYSDDLLQATLDRYRYTVTEYLIFSDDQLTWSTPWKNLDGDTKLYVGGEVATPDTADYDGGVFTFAAAPAGYVSLKGAAYDIYAAAADMWLLRASLASQWRGQYPQAAMQLVKMYRSLAWTVSVDAVRVY